MQTAKTQKIIYWSAILLASSAAVIAVNLDPAKKANSETFINQTETQPSGTLPEAESLQVADDATDAASQSSSTSTTVTNDNGELNVTVNGQDVPVPDDGSAQHTETDENGTTTTITVDNQTTSSSSSSTRVNTSSRSRTYINGHMEGQ